MNLDSMKDILDAMEAEGKAFWEIVLETDMENRQVSRTPPPPIRGSGGA